MKRARKPKPTTWNDSRLPECEQRPIEQARYFRSSCGHSELDIVCPFCSQVVTARVWSLAACGKRCGCGAILGHRGTAYRMPQPTKEPAP